MSGNEIRNFVDCLHRTHLDNACSLYQRRSLECGRSNNASPLTNFVFEFFLFNSLYSIDWEQSLPKEKVIYHSRDDSESKQQRQLLSFVRHRLSEETLNNVFLPLLAFGDLNEPWTVITPDSRLSSEDGQSFFRRCGELAVAASRRELSCNQRTFRTITSCMQFVYLVRNNVFHGSKRIGQTFQPAQARRLAFYDLFVRCLNSLAFAAFGRTDVGADYAVLPIALDTERSRLEVTTQKIAELQHRRLLKSHDSRVWMGLHQQHPELLSGSATPGDALFSPSSGRDFAFPLLLGLLTCTEFYFYDSGARRTLRQRDLEFVLRQLGIPPARTVLQSEMQITITFEFAEVCRTIHLLSHDNLDFLERDVALRYYFHRGDSQGEGGSGQLWDTELFPELLKKVPAGRQLRFFTDGQPGGPCSQITEEAHRITLPASRLSGNRSLATHYYAGEITGPG